MRQLHTRRDLIGMSSLRNGLKLLSRLLPSGASQAENGKHSIVNTSTPFPILGSPQRGERKTLRVLTLTPFYPSANDDATGCFVAEPLRALSNLGIASAVVAVQPFYRGQLQAAQDSFPSEWMRYLSLPGGIGLPTAGASVFARVVGKVRHLQQTTGIDLIHAHGALPCGHAAMLLNAELGLPYVVTVHGRDAFSTEQVKGRAGEWCRRISQRVYRIIAESDLHQ